jgi:N-acyl-D-aspartate/D-glutamate deacylase
MIRRYESLRWRVTPSAPTRPSYDATIVSGVVTQRGGKATGARPGRLVRGAQGGSQPRIDAAAS